MNVVRSDKDAHYSNAIEDAVNALGALVKLNSGVGDMDRARVKA